MKPKISSDVFNIIHLRCVLLCSLYINPLLPRAANTRRIAKIFILEGIIKKISYERRDYESVDEKSLS